MIKEFIDSHVSVYFCSRLWRLPLLLASVAVIGGVSEDMDAQESSVVPELPEAGNFSLARFRPAVDRHGLQNVEWGGFTDETFIEVTTLMHYMNDPLVLRRIQSGDTSLAGPLLHHRIDADVIVTLGLCYVQIAIGTRYTLYQNRPTLLINSEEEGLLRTKTINENLPSLRSLRKQGFGDFFFFSKVPLLSENRDPFALSVLVTATVPASEGDYLSDTSITLAPGMAASTRLGAFRGAINLGAILRRETQLADLEVEKELFYRIGLGYHFAKWQAEETSPHISVSLSGAVTASKPFENVNQTPLEIVVGGAYDIGLFNVQMFAGGAFGLTQGHGNPDFRLFGGLRHRRAQRNDRDNDGVPDSQDRAPREPEDKDGYQDFDGVPDPDNDGDTIPDSRDQAPMVAEDLDGFRDSDGIPEFDNDGDGIPDIYDRAPNRPEDIDQFQDEDGAPEADNDGDGILDDLDGAPNRAEDLDGFEDDNGIPDPDNDNDGILDSLDAAPNRAEDKDGFQDEDGAPDPDNDGDMVLDIDDLCPNEFGSQQYRGCPDTDGDGVSDRFDSCPMTPGSETLYGCTRKPAVIITENAIQVAEKIYFESAQAVIAQRSYNLLDDIATVLANHPELSAITIEGHTDSRGDEKTNLVLSQARAEAVRDYLISRGIVAERLRAKGLGEIAPETSNNTARGRAQNRRVNFIIEAFSKNGLSTSKPD